MKRKIAVVMLAVSLFACIGLLVGCTESASDDEDSAVITEAITTTSATEVEAEEESTVQNSYIGKVSYASSSYFAINLYETADGSTIEDFTALDTSTLSEVGSLEYIILGESVSYYIVEDGIATDGSAEDVAEDIFVAILVENDEAQQIYIYPIDEVASEDEAEGDNDTSEQISVSADIAKLESISEDGTWLLTPYVLAEEYENYVITDYSAVELDYYTPTEELIDYIVAEDTVFDIVESSVLRESTIDEVSVGDMLVIYTDENGTETIVCYPETTSTES